MELYRTLCGRSDAGWILIVTDDPREVDCKDCRRALKERSKR